MKKVSPTDRLMARATALRKPTAVGWIDRHPQRTEIIACVKQGVSLEGLRRALVEAGDTSASVGKLRTVQRQIAESRV